MARGTGIWTYDDHLRHLAEHTRGMKSYETTFREALYNPDLWLKTAEAVARWLKHCAENAHIRTLETKH